MRQLYTRACLSGALLFASGCGDPAPGEGVEQQETATTMPEVVPAAEAIRTPNIPAIDLHTMVEAEYAKVIPAGDRCVFLYSSEGGPVLAASMGEGAAKGAVMIHGRLIELRADNATSFDALASGATFRADGLRLQVVPDAGAAFERREGRMQRVADAILELEQGLKVGYRGWYACGQVDVSTRQ